MAEMICDCTVLDSSAVLKTIVGILYCAPLFGFFLYCLLDPPTSMKSLSGRELLEIEQSAEASLLRKYRACKLRAKQVETNNAGWWG